MKFFCFLLTSILVNVLANDEKRYKEVVFITNEIINLAYNMNDFIVGENAVANGLEYVIEKIVNDDGYFKCFAKINFLIAIPDKMDIVFNIPGISHHNLMNSCNYYQFIFQLEIINTLGIMIPGFEDSQNYESLNLTTLAEQRRCQVESALKNIFRREFGSMYDEFILQLEIRDTLNTDHLNLTTLTEDRRVTGTPLKNVVRRVLGTGISKDDEDQRTDVSEVVEDQRTEVSQVVEEQRRSVHHAYLFGMCRLMGLYLSTKFPASYIKEIEIDPINYTCNLNEGNLQRRLKKINGIWWQISSITTEAENTI